MTWQKFNRIGFSRRCKFWPVVFLWSNLWRRDSFDDSVRIWHYINYPASYSKELINLCWYCWGGGLYHVGDSRVLSLSEILMTGVQPWTVLFVKLDPISYYTITWLPKKPISTAFIIFYLLKRKSFRWFLPSARKLINEWRIKWKLIDSISKGNCVVKGFSQICVEKTQLGGGKSYYT